METFKKILRYVIFPHPAIVVLLVPVAIVMLVYAFVFAGGQGVLSYVSYVISAYTMTVVCFRIPAIIRFVKTVKTENKYVVRLTSDAHLRVNLSLYGSFAFNAAYAILQLGIGLSHRSVWFYSLTAYYLLLALMRFFLLRYSRGHEPGADMATELRRYRFCGYVLLFMTSTLSMIVFYIVWKNQTFLHHEITTIAMAAYTFTAFTVAIVNMIKYKKYNSPVFSASKAISFAAALVSMLTLETAMLNAFEDGTTAENFSQIMTGITGGVVVLIVLFMAVYMIVTSTKKLRVIKVHKNNT